MRTLRLSKRDKKTGCRNRVGWMLGICLLVPLAVYAARHDSSEVQSRQLAEQIYNQIRDRYPVKSYSFDNSEGQYLATFNLKDGMVLTYNARGHLVKRLEPNGYEIQYKKGYPIKKVSPLGEMIWTIAYTWTDAGEVKRTIRQQGDYITVSYFDDQGATRLEMHEGPGGKVLRYHFNRENQRIYSYFETDTMTGMTDLFFVSAVTGLIEDHWRITGRVEQIWDEKYGVFMQLIEERFRRDYADRTKFKKDSLGRTRGDILLENLVSEELLPRRTFARYVQEKMITFDDIWDFIDCSDVRVTVPAVELFENEQVLVQRAKVQGNTVLVWVKERLQWEVYPFDPREEELIPVNMRGDVRIESRYQNNQWRLVPGKRTEMYLSVRLMISEAIHRKQRERLSQHLHDDPDFDDLFTVMQQAAKKSTPTPAVQIGEAVTHFTRDVLETFRIELTFRVKNIMQAAPHLNQRDSFQRTQAELILQTLTPEKILSQEEFMRQKHRLRREVMPPFDRIIYSGLEIFMPAIKKKKLYKELTRVREKDGLIQVWKEDVDHPDNGYWTPYALRPSRDMLLQDNGRMLIRVDEGKFKWELTSVWRGKIVSGEIFMAKAQGENSQAVRVNGNQSNVALVQETRGTRGRIQAGREVEQVGMDHYLQAALPKRWHGTGLFAHALIAVIQWMMEGQTGENVVVQNITASGREISILEMRNWHGKITGYRRLVKNQSGFFSRSQYDAKKNLLTMETANGDDYRIETVGHGKRSVARRRGREKQIFHFVGNRLEAIDLTDKKRLTFTSSGQFNKVSLFDRAENLIYEKVYNEQGDQVALYLPDGEKIQYFYNRTKNILGITVENRQGQQASLILTQQGKITKHSGNGKLIYFATKQLNFIRPDKLLPLTMEFKLPSF